MATENLSLQRLNRGHQTAGNCEPDPIDPDRVPCSNPVLLDDRQGISHFFGRNKRATATIPIECYPLQCRTHYQERKYRMRDTPGTEAAYQCDCIILTLQRMSKLTWEDKATNTTWPRWVGFELQVCKTSEPSEVAEEATAPENAVVDSEAEQVSPKNAKTLRKVKPPAPIPDWLASLSSKASTGQDFVSVGDREGARYSIEQLAQIVRAIKTYCINNNARLPPVEALPITIGMVHEVDAASAKTDVETARREHHIALNAHRDASDRGARNALTLERVMEGTKGDLEAAQQALKSIKQDLESTKKTLPAKRATKRSKAKEDVKELIDADVEGA